MREITDFNYPPFKIAFENFEKKPEKVNKNDKKTQGQKKMRIFEFINCIRIFAKNTNIRISVDILNLYALLIYQPYRCIEMSNLAPYTSY